MPASVRNIDSVTKDWIFNESDEIAAKNGCRFDPERGLFVIDWWKKYLRLYEGDAWAGKPFAVQDWQWDCTMRMYGWIRYSERWSAAYGKETWLRRFRQALVFVPKKNGKSPWLAAHGLYLLCGDGEAGQKVFFAARDGGQAREIAGKHAVEMLKQSPELMSECTINKTTMQITHLPSKSLLKPISSADARSQESKEGINGCVLVDEVHVVDRRFMSRVSRAGISRAEPFQIEVSTAGNDPDSYGKERYDYGTQVESGLVEDQRLFFACYEAPQELSDADLATDPVGYGKQANPAWGYPSEHAVVPSAHTSVLIERLEALANRLSLDPPRTEKSNRLQTTTKYWRQFADQDEFVSLWCQLSDVAKLLQFFDHLQVDRVHPRYGMTRSGRATAERPNIQQMPGKESFRRLFVPGPGMLVLGLDYSSIEMLTLATECHERYGESRLREVLKRGTDPHAYTAALLLGLTYEEFQQLAETDHATYVLHRAKAKIANFGFPAGYSAQSLAFSAKVDRGIDMSVAEAESMRDKFLNVVYPELGRYMTEDLATTVAGNLRVPVEVVREAFPEEWHLPLLRRLCSGETTSRSSGNQYNTELVEDVWGTLSELDVSGQFAESISTQDFDQLRKLFWQPTVNPVGMIRGAVPFTASRNTPFQSRAAMGMRNALWTLYRDRFDVMICIHDEVVIAVPEDADHAALAHRADAIMREQMQPFCGDIPVKTEFYLARHWSKQATAVWGDRGELRVWAPEPEDYPRVTIESASVAELPVVEAVTSECHDDTVTTVPVTNDPPKASPTKPQPTRLSPPLKWFGGKHYLAKKIVELMPEHVHYVEPFAGGMAVLWAKPFEGTSEVANDIYGRLINFYRHLADEELFGKFVRRVEALPVSQELWQESQQQADDPLEDAVRFFILNRQSRSGQMQSFVTLSRNRTRRGQNEQVSSWLSAIEGLQEVHQRLQRVVLLNDDAVSVIQKQDGPNTLFYADPPYLHETRVATNVYAHEMTDAEHQRLLDTLTQVQGKVILSGYPSPLYDQALREWRREEIEIDNKASAAKSKKKMTEVLWMNY